MMTADTRKKLFRIGGTVIIIAAATLILTLTIITINAFIDVILKGP